MILVYRRPLQGLLFAALSLSLAGCSGADKSYVPTRGQLFIGDKPAEGALVVLVPASGPDDPSARPTGIVGPDGSFVVSTYEAETRKTHEGAPAGEYSVAITWYPQAAVGSGGDREAAKVDRLGGRYADASKNSFRVKVGAPTTELEPIRLKVSDDLGKGRKP